MNIKKTTARAKLPLLTKIQNLLGAGLYLLLTAGLTEALTIIARRWVSFPIPLTLEMKTALTSLCVLLCLGGSLWFNATLNLVKTHLLEGKKELLSHGPFNYVRHPLYTTWLMTLPPLLIIWTADMLFLGPWIFLFIIAHYVVRLEERGLREMFGKDYQTYQMYVPALLPYKGAGGAHYRDQHPKKETA